MLSISRLSYQIGDKVVLDEVALDLQQGEVLGLLGPSGSGKTSLARVITGLYKPSVGEIELEGKDLSNVPACNRPIAYQQQGFPLYPHMTVIQNVQVALERTAMARSHKPRLVEDIMVAVGIPSALWFRKPDNLSGGEAQRVAFAKALLKQSRLLILDEPFSNLNKEYRLQLGQLIRDRIHDRAQGCLYISHDEHDLILVSDRVAVMENGRISQAAGIQNLLQGPNTARAAGIASELGLQWLAVSEWLAVTSSTNPITDSLPHGTDRIAWRPEDAEIFVADTQLQPKLSQVYAEIPATIKRAVVVGRRCYFSVAVPTPQQKRELWCVTWDRYSQDAPAFDGKQVRIRIPQDRLLYLDKNDQVNNCQIRS